MFPKLLSFCQSPLKHNLSLETKHYYHYYHYKPCELVFISTGQTSRCQVHIWTVTPKLPSFLFNAAHNCDVGSSSHTPTDPESEGMFCCKRWTFCKAASGPEADVTFCWREASAGRQNESSTFGGEKERQICGGSKLLPIPKGRWGNSFWNICKTQNHNNFLMIKMTQIVRFKSK